MTVRPVPSFLAPFVKLHEGFVARAQPDPVGFSTIGYGHKLGPTDPLAGATLSMQDASALLDSDLLAEATFLCTLDDVSLLTDGQYAALVDFVFNEGIGQYRTSHLRQCVLSGDWNAVPAELQKWVYARGQVLPGLVSRRAGEIAMWLGHYPPAPTA